jgi:hypothetical protein
MRLVGRMALVAAVNLLHQDLNLELSLDCVRTNS